MKINKYIIGTLLIITPIIIWLLKFHSYYISSDPNDWSIFANYIAGTVNVIITILGFIILILTFRKQIDDSNAQAHDAYVSSFENTLFKLNEYNHFIKMNIEYSKSKIGLLAVNSFASEINQLYLEKANQLGDIKDHYDQLQKYIKETYPLFYREDFYKLGHWFRHLYHIYKYIDNSKLNDDEKTFYAKMIRSEMSVEEMVLIGFNGMTIYGEKFKNYIEKYELLHRLMNINYTRSVFISFYNQKAFGDEDIFNTLPENETAEMWYYENLKTRSNA
jgi:hypothetical protein